MPKYYEFKVAGYYLYFTSFCTIECMHVHASDKKLTEAGSAKFFVKSNGDTELQKRGILNDREISKIQQFIKDNYKVKTVSNIKDTYTDEDLETMRDNCTELRDLAMIDMLASTGMRVGEMVLLNKMDINFNERECVVFGKGNKERIVYFDARAKIHLQNYLESRKDDSEALFVTLKSPHTRLTIGGIEIRIRELGKKLGMQKVHPHKFRRTLATQAIDKGMPIEQLQRLLGHQRIDTTLQYAMVKQSNVKIAHRKYIG